MCWEDQKKARKIMAVPKIISPGTQVTIPANPNRVRVSLCTALGANLFVSLSTGSIAANVIAIMSQFVNTVLLRSEDYGQALTGPLTIDATAATGDSWLTEMILIEEYKE